MYVACVLTLALALLATPARGQSEADRLADLLALARGMTVAEIGAGDGDFALAVAERVGPGGRVLATELEAEKRDEIRAAAKQAGLANVEVLEPWNEPWLGPDSYALVVRKPALAP
jgi:cyclopropane fatty-acyl-phospholipid synthase-like methyltransferase